MVMTACHTGQTQGHAPVIARGNPSRLSPSHCSLRLAAVPQAAGDVRRVIRKWLPGVGLAALEDPVTQVAGELVANAVEESSLRSLPAVRVVLVAFGGRVLVEVWDMSERPPGTGAPPGSLVSEHGRGLFIVQAIAEQWGWHPRADIPGKCVWALVGADPPWPVP
jgi:anti-sigma regulatory factor (Ser/Thr protein kinase)